MQIGDIVRHKESGRIGKVVYSTFGVSVSGRDEKGHWKTLGYPVEEMKKHWEVIENE